jgi:hypothetical protein
MIGPILTLPLLGYDSVNDHIGIGGKTRHGAAKRAQQARWPSLRTRARPVNSRGTRGPAADPDLSRHPKTGRAVGVQAASGSPKAAAAISGPDRALSRSMRLLSVIDWPLSTRDEIVTSTTGPRRYACSPLSLSPAPASR